MNQVPKIVLTISMVAAIAFLAIGQSQKKDAGADKEKKTIKRIPVYLGKSEYSSGSISERVFDSLIRQGITSRDSAGRPYKVLDFAFTYCERNLYEDSVGNPMILTDYMTEYCYGDTLTAFLQRNIPERSKAGDTVLIDQVTLLSPEGTGAIGKYMKFVLKK